MSQSNVKRTKKYFQKYKESKIEIPNLTETQLKSYEWFIKKGIKEVFKEFSPIKDYSSKKFEIEFKKFEIGEPKNDAEYAKDRVLTYETPLKAQVKLKNKTLGTEKEQEIFLSDLPVITERGTFIINGIERVIVSQIVRSFGVFFTSQIIKGKTYFGAKIIPSRGVWMEFESNSDGALYVKIDRRKKFSVTSLLRILGAKYEKDILSLFENSTSAKEVIKNTLENDNVKSVEEAYVEIHKKIREGETATPEHAREHIQAILNEDRYDLSEVGRYRFNQRFNKALNKEELNKRTISLDDIVSIIFKIVELNKTPNAVADDIDHLGFRRVRAVGELLQQRIRVGMSYMKRNIQDRMSVVEAETTMPANLINPRPLQARIKEFFATNQLSQYMSQDNILYEVENLRTLSALGPGGLTRERAGFEVRDVHFTHYGRLCPTHTPEGPNIGLILRLASYAKVNDYGILETPYIKVKDGVITEEVVYLNALDEEGYKIAHAVIDFDENKKIKQKTVEVRIGDKLSIVPREEADYIDVATNQAFSVATSLIPFLENDDANRALMGSNMQKQAVPCLKPEAPLVATGIEKKVARDSGRLVIAKEAGEVKYVDARKITIAQKDGKKKDYKLLNFKRNNSFTIFHHRPSVSLEEKVKKGDILADVSSSADGQTAIGQNLRVAFMSWSGANYEDAIIISEKVLKESRLSSIHMEEFAVNVRDTKLGPEVTTHDIPNVGEAKLKNLDEEGVIRVGSEVVPGDILVGKVTPKGETQLTAEERLLRSIFGEKAKDVKDTSLKVKGGKRGRIVGIKIFSRENGDILESGVIKKIYIEIAQLREISVGDKLSGRHGNKGVISKILPEEDMPYDENGDPVDTILTPLGVPSRMNLGQIFEMHLGLAANTLNYQAVTPPFSGASIEEMKNELKKAGFPQDGKLKLFDGRNGEVFDQNIAVGYMYIMKLHHMVEDKVHMRSIGPYSLITQQPLGGKAQEGGQRIGEMEVWALLGYGAAHTLREITTIKSDDIIGRSSAFDSIVKRKRIKHPNIPASFNVLLHHLRGLSLNVELLKDSTKWSQNSN